MEEYLDVIIDNIQNQTCVLMLGPELAINANNSPLYKSLFEYISTETKLKISYDIDNFIAFDKKADKISFYTFMKKYYENNSEPTDLFNKIAQIPFHLIMSFTPDMMLKNSFDKLGIDNGFQYYSKKQTLKDVERPTQTKPLLYNLFGSTTDRDSLIITYDDMFDFIFSILGGEQRLPREMLDTISSATVFLFLGCELDKWYMKLIMRLFGLHKEPIAVTNKSSVKDEITENFFIRNFEMNFIDLTTEELISKIFTKLKDSNLLREVSQVVEIPIVKKVLDLLKSDEIETAIDTLSDYLENKNEEIFNSVIQISGTYNRMKKNQLKGIVSQENLNMETNKVRNSLIEIVNEIKNL